MTGPRFVQIPIEQVQVGNRHRQDLGDLSDLVASIRKVGLLNPITVDKKHKLIAGQRRLEAMRILGMGLVPVHVVDNLDDAVSRLEAERDENTCRKDMTPSEAVALGSQLEALQRPIAAANKGGRPSRETPRETREVSYPRFTTEKVAKAVGMGDQKYRYAKEVVEAAKTGDPIAVAAKEEMDRTGNVGAARNKIQSTATPRPELPPSVGSIRSLPRKHRAAVVLGKIAETLDGTAAVLETLDVSEIEGDEAQVLADRLVSFRSALSRSINQLRSISV